MRSSISLFFLLGVVIALAIEAPGHAEEAALLSQGERGPHVVAVDPAPAETVRELRFVSVTFDGGVTGVDASDLLVNGLRSTNVHTLSPREYTFYFQEPATGQVQIAWAADNRIEDTSASGNAFAGGTWEYTLDPAATPDSIIISEFLASNAGGLRDEDRDRPDWIELRNTGEAESNLDGWFLTDDPADLTKWRIPAVAVARGGHLLIWASGKNRHDPAAELHTNFRLAAAGGYLALADPQTNVVSEFAPLYPPQQPDVWYGRDAADPNLAGYFTTPTPGAQNATRGPGFAEEPVFSVESGVYTNETLSLAISAPAGSVIRYTVDGAVPATNSPLYSTPLVITGSANIKARAYLPGTNLFPSPVVSRTFVLLDQTTRDFRSKVPLVIVSTSGRTIPQNILGGAPRVPGTLVVIDTVDGQCSLTSAPQFQGWADYEVFGQTSAGFPKQPYRIEVQDELRNDLAVPLLGMPAEADWRLRNPYTDKHLMGDFLAFELYEQMGHYSLRRQFVEVFVDRGGGKLSYPDDYLGIMLLMENIEYGEGRVNIARLSSRSANTEPTITGGYIWKKDKDSAGDLNFTTAGGGGFGGLPLKLHAPKPREVNNNVNHPQVVWLRNYLNQMEQSMYATNWLTATGTNHYSHYVDVDNWVDQHWIVEFTKNIDGYRFGNFMHKDRGGKVKMAPIWDWELSFGNADYLEGGRTNGWYYTLVSAVDHTWLRRLINGGNGGTGVTTIGDPDFCQLIADRWGVLRTSVLNGARLTNRIQEIAARLNAPSFNGLSAVNREFAKWPRLGSYIWPNPSGGPTWHVDYVKPTNYTGIISELKNWTFGRHNWIDAQFAKPVQFGHGGGQIPPDFQLAIAAAPNHTIYYTLNGEDPRLPGGGTHPGALVYSGQIPITSNARVFARTRAPGAWQNTWSGPNVITLYTHVPALRITELMYHPHDPPSPSLYLDEDFEYVEIKNIGSVPIQLEHVRLRGQVEAAPGPGVLQPGAYAVIVANVNAFRARYGDGPAIAGTFSGRLDNGGGRIVLEGPMGEPIHDFRYDDSWHQSTDGHGFSLVTRNEDGPLSEWRYGESWRPSGLFGGSPGAEDPQPPALPRVIVSELLSSNAVPTTDRVELQNLEAAPANISGWFLTDDISQPQKFRIPDGTTIPAHSFLLLDEMFFQSASAPLFERGVYLFSGDGPNLTGFANGFDFGPSPTANTLGRHVISTGEDHFVVQSRPTPGQTNAGPLVGPVVISEILYNPIELQSDHPNHEDEYVELHNSSDHEVNLYDTNAPGRTWQLAGGIEFAFPPNVSVDQGDYFLVVNFDPGDARKLSRFINAHSVAPGTRIFGPYSGALNNDGDDIELLRPGGFGTDGTEAYIRVERVNYKDEEPWPSGADGAGAALQRVDLAPYGNDPANWTGAGKSPGARYLAGPAPVIAQQPADVVAVTGDSASLTVEVIGPTPLSYRWRHNGQLIQSAGGPQLVIPSVQPPDAGTYDVVVISPSGWAVSRLATLTVLSRAQVTQEPADAILQGSTNMATYGQSASNVVFSMGALSEHPPIRYQWRFNGVPIPGATDDTLTVANVDLSKEGFYDAIVTDAVSSVASRAAALRIHIRPYATGAPELRNQILGVGDRFVLSFGARGNPLPLTYIPRRAGSNFMSMTTNSFVGTFVLPNVQLRDAQSYTIVVSNAAGMSSPPMSRFFSHLVVVAPPNNQTVAVGADATFGANVRFSSLMANPAANLRYQWLFNGVPINGATNTNLVVSAVQPGNAGIYSFAVTNFEGTNAAVGPVVASFNALLSITEADGDGDGMPDSFEQQYNLNRGANDSGDDADGDGVTNIDEYRSGTDPRDAQNYLRIEISANAQEAILEFMAVSNRSYSVLYRDDVHGGEWVRLRAVAMRASNRLERIADPTTAPRRYYRLVTP